MPRRPLWSDTLLATLVALIVSACGSDGSDGDGGAIEGTVMATDATLIPGAAIAVISSAGESRSAVSDSIGHFRIAELPNGTYAVRVRLPLGFDTTAQSRQWYVEGAEIVLPDIRVRGGTVTLAVRAAAIRQDSTVTTAGRGDTLATAGGAVVVVNPPTGLSGLTVIVRDTNVSATGSTGPTVRLQIVPSASLRAAPSGGSGLVLDLAIWFVKTTIASAVTLGQFSYEGLDALGPLTLWSDATSTTYIDPRTGLAHVVPLTRLQVDPSKPLDVLVRYAIAETRCDDSHRALRAADGSAAPDGRIPLVLIHGWQFKGIGCGWFDGHWRDTDVDPFGDLLPFISSDPLLSSRYKVYLLRYPTIDPVPTASEYLWTRLAGLGAAKPVLLGHSMGGLVARSMLAAHGENSAAGVITLGTPHEGAPVADILGRPLGAATATVSPCMDSPLIGALVSIYPQSPGVEDLRPSGTFITAIGSAIPGPGRVFSFAGQLGLTSAFTDPLMARLACLTAQLSGLPNDGVVPVSSAAPTWSTLQTVRPGYNHFDMASGVESSRAEYFGSIKAALAELSDCPAPPPRPVQNDFPMSGAVARKSAASVDVTLNPIVIGGVPAIGLNAGNFTVIENGCVRPFSVTTSEGKIGVDIVFAQDLSSSMANSITAVRSSVLAFAQNLAARGIDVRLGSVGYSGPGTIATTPATSACEFLGPVRDLTDPVAFQAHVQAAWRLGEGCDPPENGLEAIEYAHQHFGWRAGAARVYIDITDVSHHWAGTSCNGFGACTDENLASVAALVGSTSTIHVVAPSSLAQRTAFGGLDPYSLAVATGGRTVDLGSGVFDLTALGITDAIGQTVRLTFPSGSNTVAFHDLRVRVQSGGLVAEFAPGLVPYVTVDPSLVRGSRTN